MYTYINRILLLNEQNLKRKYLYGFLIWQVSFVWKLIYVKPFQIGFTKFYSIKLINAYCWINDPI